MPVRILIFLIVCAGEATGSSEKVSEVAPGNDVSLSCPCTVGQSCWTGPQIRDTMRVNINNTEHLLIKYFKDQNNGRYVCNRTEVNLTPRHASISDHSTLFRASEGDSVFLFCKNLVSSSKLANWSWRAHHLNQSIPLTPVSPHFGNRLHLRNKNDDSSLSISNIQWGDSGRYECQRPHSSSQPKTFFELVVVRVQTDPQQLTEGDNVTLQCEVSHHLPNTQLYWINRETQENFPNPHQLRNVNMGQRDWTCAVFTSSTLKALIPLTLNISITKTSPPPTSPDSRTNTDPSPPHRDFTLISVCTVLSFLLLVLIGAVFWRRKTKEWMRSSGSAADSITYADVKLRPKSEWMRSSGSAADSITYADVKLRPKSERCAGDGITYAAVNFRQKSERLESPTSAGDSITYAAVNVRQKSKASADVGFAECSPISKNHLAEEKEVIYSSIHLS